MGTLTSSVIPKFWSGSQQGLLFNIPNEAVFTLVPPSVWKNCHRLCAGLVPETENAWANWVGSRLSVQEPPPFWAQTTIVPETFRVVSTLALNVMLPVTG